MTETKNTTVRARIRPRIGANDPIPDEHRWDQQTAASYTAGRDMIRDRLADTEQVTAWYVDQI